MTQKSWNMHPPIPGSKQQLFFTLWGWSVWAAVKQKLFFKGCLFSKDCPSSQQFFFSKTLWFYLLSFFSKTLHLFSRSFFQRFFTCQSFFSNVFFSKTFFSTVCFFQSCFFGKGQTEQNWSNHLVGQPVLLSLSIAKVYLRVPCSLSFFKTIFFSKGSP